MPSRPGRLRLASVLALVSVVSPLGTPAAAQHARANGAYAGPVYSTLTSSAVPATPAVPASHGNPATPALPATPATGPSFTFATPPGYYVSATVRHSGASDDAGHRDDASCFVQFDCGARGKDRVPFHFTPDELGAVADPGALSAYMQHLDYMGPVGTITAPTVQTVAVTPEPGSNLLLATGLGGLAGVVVVRRRRR